MSTAPDIREWKHYPVANELRELRKLLHILDTWGNIIVPGGITTNDRIHQILPILENNGIRTVQDCEIAIEELNKYYPAT